MTTAPVSSAPHYRQTHFPSTNDTRDNFWKGDSMAETKPENSVRMLFQNVRGFQFEKTGNKLKDIVQLQDYHGLDVLCISEHHQDTTSFRKRMEMSDIVHSLVPGRAACQFDSSAESTHSGTKRGGTGIITVGSLVGQLEPKGRGGDPMGRWSYMSYRRKDLPPITIISVYQVCKDPGRLLGETTWHQQRRALDDDGRDIDPRNAFISDLSSFIKQLQQQQHDIIVGGDFNETIHDPRSGLLRLASATGLSDPWLTRYPNHPILRQGALHHGSIVPVVF